MVRYFSPILVLSAIVFSCAGPKNPGGGSQYPGAETFTDSLVPEVRSLTGEKLPFPELMEPLALVQQNGYIYLVNSDRMKNRISVYTTDGRRLCDMLSRGRGPGEALSGRYLYYAPQRNALVHTDYVQQKVLLYDVDTLENNLSRLAGGADRDGIVIRPQEEIRLDETACWRSFPARNGETVSLTLSEGDRPWIITTAPNGTLLRSCGAHPALPDAVDPVYWSQIFACNAVVDSAAGRMAVLYQNTDLLDIYDLATGERLHRLHGPAGFYPKFRCERQGNTYPAFSIDGETRDAYFVGVSRGSLIWASYSGHTVSDEIQPVQHIYAFDWEGTPRMKFTVDRPVLSFDVAPESRTIYVLSYEEDGNSHVYRYVY